MSQTPSLTLYHFPGACSMVTRTALAEAGLDYQLEIVNLARNEQSGEAYRRISPLGKVPALVADGEVLTENAALLVYVDALRPEAGIFPPRETPAVAAEIQKGLSFCSGTLHPIVRGLANPVRFTTGPVEGVRERSTELAHQSFGYAAERILKKGWWFDEWSIIDIYLVWNFFVACHAGFDGSALPALQDLQARCLERECFAVVFSDDMQRRAALGL